MNEGGGELADERAGAAPRGAADERLRAGLREGPGNLRDLRGPRRRSTNQSFLYSPFAIVLLYFKNTRAPIDQCVVQAE